MCCGQTVGFMTIPLRMEVGLGQGHIVLYGNPGPPTKRHTSILGPFLLWPNGWMDKDATWYKGRFRPRPHCVRWEASSPKKGHSSPPHFWPMSIVGLGSGDIVLDGNRTPYGKGHSSPPLFGRCLFWPNGWMDHDTT